MPDKTKWKAYKKTTRGIYVDVDTRAAGFKRTPVYVASIAGDSHHWETTGGSAIYAATPKGFRIYVRYAGDQHGWGQVYRCSMAWMGSGLSL